jgi:hypothetical protein
MELFDDEEAAFALEIAERELAWDKAKKVSDPAIRDTAIAHLMEEMVQSGAKFFEEILSRADSGEIEITEDFRKQLLRGLN